MARDRESEIRDGVLFDRHNVLDTANHCRVRNLYLQGKTDSTEAAAEKLIAEVLQQIQGGACTPGQLFPVFNAWAVVDVPAPGTAGMIGGHDITHARLHANFFVRLGRQPALRDVNEGDSR